MMRKRFCDLIIGERFKYLNSNDVWVAVETYGDGLIARWSKSTSRFQSLCKFVDDNWCLESEVDVISYPVEYSEEEFDQLLSDNGWACSYYDGMVGLVGQFDVEALEAIIYAMNNHPEWIKLKNPA